MENNLRNYAPTIGLEIHAELKTDSKMFCPCRNDPDENRPNHNVCPICLGHPGTLPILNRAAIAKVLSIGAAVGGELADFTEWDRKQYFYPDIPKGYQISQYAYPLITGGELAGVALERIHLEEDTARSTHDKPASGTERSLVDFNRSGVPLMELVTKPVIAGAKEAVRFARELRLLLRALGAGEANLEKGEMRIEANISVRRAGQEKLGTKTEVKNLNSFRSAEKAIEYEIERQVSVIEDGGEVVQETRGWDDRKGETYSQRSKESAKDYRYFPDPDIPKMKISLIPEFAKDALAAALPELPWRKRDRFKAEYGATDKEAEMFIEDEELAEYFDTIANSKLKRQKSKPQGKNQSSLGNRIQDDDKKFLRLAMNYLLTDYMGFVKNADRFAISPENWRELIDMIMAGELSSRGAKETLAKMVLEPSLSPRKIALEAGLMQENDPELVRKVVKAVIEANHKVVAEFKAGKAASLQYLIGQVMKEAKGAANPGVAKQLLEQEMRN